MSTAGSLARGEYTDEAVRMARAHKEFVIGFIAQRRMEGVGLRPGESMRSDEDFLILAPGVGLDVTGDGMGQQYRTPKQVIFESGCDVIIVGRGVYGNPATLDVQSVREQAERYRKAGWDAYLERVKRD
jgi:orotidine-5'-phosphate decarboxylase